MIKKESYPEQAVLDLISDTFLGSEGAQYKLLDGPFRAQNLDNPLFVYIKRNEKVLGNITFCNRMNNGISENYIRYFSFDPKLRSTKESKNKKGNSKLKTLFAEELNQDVFSKSELFTYYGFIDEQNFQSMGMGNQFGFEIIGTLTVKIISKLNPKRKLNIEIADQSEYLKFLESEYGDYNFFHPINIKNGTTYILKKNGEIIHAATFYPTSWEIKSLPGRNGKLKLRWVQKLPWIKRFFDKNKLRFLGMEGLISKNPESINDFLESVLEIEKHRSILWWYDTKSKFSLKLEEKMKPGLLGRISKKAKAKIIIKTNSKLLDKYKNNPNYISAFDVS